jgi:Xaa-Pro aminopeptidase
MGLHCPYNYERYPAGLNYPWHVPVFSEDEGKKRWRAVRAAMRAEGLDCLLVGSYSGYMPGNNRLYYLSNYTPIGAMGAYLVFPLEAEPRLCVSNVIGPQFMHMAAEVAWISEIVGSMQPQQDVLNKLEELGIRGGRLGVTDYKPGNFPASVMEFLRQQLPDVEIIDASWMLEKLMNAFSRTSREEEKFVRRACEIMDASCRAVREILKPGVSENELWAAAEAAVLREGGWYPHNFFVTTGPAPLFPRGPASQRVLEKGDIALFEMNCTYGGVSPQSCFAFSLGRPRPDVKVLFDFCEGLYGVALAELEKGRTFGEVELDLAARIHGGGYEPMTPQMHIYNMGVNMPMDGRPQPGDYFTVHPNLCDREYRRGAKVGDCVRIDAAGKAERLQQNPARLETVEI